MEVGQPCLITNIVLLVSSEQKPKAINSCGKPADQYDAFTSALRKILQVSHAEMLERLAEEKKARASRPQPSSRASHDKG